MTVAVLETTTSRETICQHCGASFRALRASARFCSARCQKAAKRESERPVNDSPKTIITELRQRGMIGKIWPVYRWDDTPPVYALLVPRAAAVEELALAGFNITDPELRRLLQDAGIADYGEKVEERRIKYFYESRRNRRVEAQNVSA